MTTIGSNNPFRNSIAAAEDENTTARSPPPPSHPLSKPPSTTTIIEEDETEAGHQSRRYSPDPPSTPPPTGPLPELPKPGLQPLQTAFIIDSNKHKSLTPTGNGDGHILITVHSTDSATSTPPQTGSTHPTHRLSLDPGKENCTMWPALRFTQKAKFKSRRTWIIIKVTIAVVIVVGAVAIGLGISKAVNDAKDQS